MAFALAGQPGETENFILAFRDIDKSIRKHIADKRYLREQLDIVETLSRDYYNIFKINKRVYSHVAYYEKAALCDRDFFLGHGCLV